MARNRSMRRRRQAAKQPFMPEIEFAQLGDGVVGYIRIMTSEEAKERFPSVNNLPKGLTLYALHAADGTPLALTDTRQAALSHAMGDDLEVATVH